MRFLFVVHWPWRRELGGARVFVELAAELERQGHVVDHVAGTDAHIRPRSAPLELVRRPFGRLVRDHVAAVASRYDVVDALEGDLPYSKAKLDYRGLLVARSVGLSLAFKEFLDFSAGRWPDQETGHPAAQALRELGARRRWPRHERSWRLADVVALPNPDELRFLPAAVQERAVVLPYGLTPARLAVLRELSGSPGRRRRGRKVVFVGYWYPRKGSLDMAHVVRKVRRQVPDAQFCFLGTSFPRERVVKELRLDEADWITVVPSYADEDLPALLADAAVGVFPSYVEGFPFAVLEQLGSGVPPVSYDAAGTREMLAGFDPALLVPRGDAEGLAARIAWVLSLEQPAYEELARTCVETAAGFTWETTARRTVDAYTQRLEELSRGD